MRAFADTLLFGTAANTDFWNSAAPLLNAIKDSVLDQDVMRFLPLKMRLPVVDVLASFCCQPSLNLYTPWSLNRLVLSVVFDLVILYKIVLNLLR